MPAFLFITAGVLFIAGGLVTTKNQLLGFGDFITTDQNCAVPENLDNRLYGGFGSFLGGIPYICGVGEKTSRCLEWSKAEDKFVDGVDLPTKKNKVSGLDFGGESMLITGDFRIGGSYYKSIFGGLEGILWSA